MRLSRYHADDAPEDWQSLGVYSQFLARHTLVSLRIEVWESLRRGNRETRSLGPLGLVALSPRVRTYLRAHLRTGAWVAEGPGALFQAVAWVESWARAGPLDFLWARIRHRALLEAWAEARAQQLTEAWLAWRNPGRK